MAQLKNEIGNIYGYLKVVARGENDKEGRARWVCQCKCGNTVVVRGKALRNGNTKSCGCYQKERAAQSNMDRAGSLVGKTFGNLEVIEEAGFITHTSGKRSRIYNCLCKCGNYCQVQHQYLAFGDTISCGCVRSKGEVQIANLLKQENIKFRQEYSFPDLKDKLLLRFDFAVFNSKDVLVGLIEFQGEQHFQESNGFYSAGLIKHDNMKREYCSNKGIPLVEIKYKKNYNLNLEDLQLERMVGLFD